MSTLPSIALLLASGILAGLALASALLATWVKREIKQIETAATPTSGPTATPTAWVTPDGRALIVYEPSLRRYRTEDLHRDPSLSD